MLRRMMCLALFSLALAPAAAPAGGWSLAASEDRFQRVDDRDAFVELMRRGTLNRFGISLKVEPDGRIEGRAFGRDVSGAWNWRDGFFCRDLNWGSTELGPNCQEVLVSGRLVRFTSDEGSGRFADLRLE